MTREEIISRLVQAFGHHLAYDNELKAGVPTGHNEWNVPFTRHYDTEVRGSYHLRPATYGEIADAIMEAG